jgi:aerotaxis receptor
MRLNTPVTDIEYILGESETIVSKTDLQGNITYANQDFIKISGYSEAELLGAPQNIVRHPDMPREAFEDLWRTLKAGRAWTGLVKNRCKNGDFYWVEANAAPYLEKGRVVGYTSIRIKPSRAKVDAARQAYQRIRDGDDSLIIREGVALARPGPMRFPEFGGASLSLRLNLILCVSVGLPIVALALLLAGADRDADVAIILSVVFSLAGLIALRHAVLAPLDAIRRYLDQMSSGDLTGHVDAKGSVEATGALQALRILQINFKLLVGQIKETGVVVHAGATEIASGNADLSARTESQASSLEETAASMEEIASAVKQNADNAHGANDLVLAATRVAGKGGAAMHAVVSNMTAIKNSSGKIAEIIGVIDGIAFQTNILALNAAVEAARAGEQGRGFAVVATEVRNLAHRSAVAAKEIKRLIAESVSEVDSGSELVVDAGRIMTDIVASISHVERYVNDISIASKEQSCGIEQINEAIVQIDEITQQNAAVVEEAAAAAETMRRQANQLNALIGHFKLVATGPALTVVASAPARRRLPGKKHTDAEGRVAQAQR